MLHFFGNHEAKLHVFLYKMQFSCKNHVSLVIFFYKKPTSYIFIA